MFCEFKFLKEKPSGFFRWAGKFFWRRVWFSGIRSFIISSTFLAHLQKGKTFGRQTQLLPRKMFKLEEATIEAMKTDTSCTFSFFSPITSHFTNRFLAFGPMCKSFALAKIAFGPLIAKRPKEAQRKILLRRILSKLCVDSSAVFQCRFTVSITWTTREITSEPRKQQQPQFPSNFPSWWSYFLIVVFCCFSRECASPERFRAKTSFLVFFWEVINVGVPPFLPTPLSLWRTVSSLWLSNSCVFFGENMFLVLLNSWLPKILKL